MRVERLHHEDTFTGERVRFADLTDFYPSPVQPSVNGAGAPAAPASVSRGSVNGGAPFHHSPALTVIALVAASLILLHHA